MTRVLFVCLGNICRSPMAEAMARALYGELAEFESAGVSALEGYGASSGMVAVARERGLDLRSHRARDAATLNLDEYDMIVAMTPSIAATLRHRLGARSDRLVTLDVDDPYGGDREDYRRCASAIEAAIRELSERLPSDR